MADWYYEENGQQRGPVSEADLSQMLADGLLDPGTRLWTAAFGPIWKRATDTPLGASLKGPPPLCASKVIMPPPLEATQPSAAPTDVSSPTWRAPTDAYAKLLAVSPLLLLAIDVAFALDGEDVLDGAHASVTPFLGFWASVALAALDARNLYRSGHNPKQKALVPFVILTPFAYFWRRGAVLKLSYGYLWTWIACALLYVIGLIVVAS